MRDACARDVRGQQERNGEREDELDCFAHRHAERSPPIERDEPEDGMRDQRGVQHERAERIPPEQDEPPPAGLGGADGNQAERMIAEVRHEVGDENQPGPEPELLDVCRPQAFEVRERHVVSSLGLERQHRRTQRCAGDAE